MPEGSPRSSVRAERRAAPQARKAAAAPSRAARKKLSVVIPLYNEDGNVQAVVDRVAAALAGTPLDLEIVLVDDGSVDDTWLRIQAAAARDDAVKGYRLSRNFGHQQALLAGIEKATGDAVVSMDGDLQHPPELIPELVAHWMRGCQIVTTQRRDTAAVHPLKRATSRWFYRAFSKLAEVELSEGSSDFRLIGRPALNELLRMQSPNPFLRGAVQTLGFRSASVPFDVAPRHSGVSKYGVRRMAKFASSAMVSPLHRTPAARRLDGRPGRRAGVPGAGLCALRLRDRADDAGLGVDHRRGQPAVRVHVRPDGADRPLHRRHTRHAAQPSPLHCGGRDVKRALALAKAPFSARLSRFVAVGVSNTLLSYLVFMGLIMGLPSFMGRAGVAQAVAYGAGVVWSYVWNSRWVFRSPASGAAFGRFVLVQLVCLIATALSLSALVDGADANPTLAWIAVGAAAAVFNFQMSKLYVFASRPAQDSRNV